MKFKFMIRTIILSTSDKFVHLKNILLELVMSHRHPKLGYSNMVKSNYNKRVFFNEKDMEEN